MHISWPTCYRKRLEMLADIFSAIALLLTTIGTYGVLSDGQVTASPKGTRAPETGRFAGPGLWSRPH